MYLNSPYNVVKSLRSMFSFYSYTWENIKLMYAKVLVQTLSFIFSIDTLNPAITFELVMKEDI